ncbi:MAG: hypothetical protein RMJ38_00060 [candidate division WOR-3 bacterium]|nr:hypothetical protein [candidate division WOR-3 bacterium]MDW8149828.1 hypothetical protein [candidate division WOR-3 bacterium]
MVLTIFLLNLEDVVNYYANVNIYDNVKSFSFYKSKKSKFMYSISASFYDSKEYTYYFGYLRNGNKFLIERKNDSVFLFINDNLVSSSPEEIPTISPYRMFIYLYQNNFPYTVKLDNGKYSVRFYTEDKNFLFLIDQNYRILKYVPPSTFEIIFE